MTLRPTGLDGLPSSLSPLCDSLRNTPCITRSPRAGSCPLSAAAPGVSWAVIYADGGSHTCLAPWTVSAARTTSAPCRQRRHRAWPALGRAPPLMPRRPRTPCVTARRLERDADLRPPPSSCCLSTISSLSFSRRRVTSYIFLKGRFTLFSAFFL